MYLCNYLKADEANPRFRALKTRSTVKKASFTVVTANDDGYKAEELWIVNLAEKDHDCRLPRGVV